MPGVTANKIRKPRNYNLKFSNAWHLNSETVIKDEGYRAACESKGIRVYSPQEIIRPHLPTVETSEEELKKYLDNNPEKKPISSITEHPDYQDVPCKLFNHISKLIKHAGLDQAKVLTNSVQIEEGLPRNLIDKIAKVSDILPQSEELMKDILLDSRVFDATQIKLPKNVAVPHIGWDPVVDRMHRPHPYELGDFSWGRNVRREYGIPKHRKNLNTIRNIMYTFDRLAVEYPALMKRQHIENSLMRQLFEKDGHNVQVQHPLEYLITDEKPVRPYANSETITNTKMIPLPDLGPVTSLSQLFDTHIYKKDNSFPLSEAYLNNSSDSITPNIHTCFSINNSISPTMDQDYFGRSLIVAFATTLAQARMKYGPEICGVLPEPIAVHFINTNGSKYHFSVFQLNTLDLNGDIKNIFWHEPEMENIFEQCDYISAIPTIEGYNHGVYNKLLAIYLHNAREIQKGDDAL